MNNPRVLNRLQRQIKFLENALEDEVNRHENGISGVKDRHRLSAINLVQYCMLRSYDLRQLQQELSLSAISSHGHAEGYTLHNLHNIHYILDALQAKHGKPMKDELDTVTSKHMLRMNKEKLLGRSAQQHFTHIMVTMPGEAVNHPEWIGEWIMAGMDVARINTAHDDPKTWEKLIKLIRTEARKQNTKVRIYMDLAGPKMRIQVQNEDSLVHLRNGDKVWLCEQVPDDAIEYPVVTVFPAGVMQEIEPSQRIWFDDGKLGGKVLTKTDKGCLVEMTRVTGGMAKLRSGKGFNLPDTSLPLPALTDADMEVLPFIARYADMVGYSFVRKAEDVHLLKKELKELGRTDIGLILKIENKEAFNNLPSLLIAAMHFKHPGLMIARGDLAVEMGMLRLAEAQEEIMWMAEAAHIPVIWATQVFEQLVKKGKATRAEISDAVNAVRAECVMLNKGPYIADAIRELRMIDKVMMAHEDKKQSYLRPLNMARGFVNLN
jgi:pyruvate kinase